MGSPMMTVPVRASAASRVSTPSSVAIHFAWNGRMARTVTGRPLRNHTAPGAVRSGRSEEMTAVTSPRRPWALPMRPISRLLIVMVFGDRATSARDDRRSVDELDVDLDLVLHCSGAHDGADALGDAPALADHTAHVAIADAHVELEAAAAAFGGGHGD